MTKEQFAALLNGREMGNEITAAEEARAKAAGLLVLFGVGDDIVAICGVTHDEVCAYEGVGLRVLPDGRLLGDFESICDDTDEDLMRKHFRDEARGWHAVEAIWCPKDDSGDIYASWGFDTALPHATFDIIPGRFDRVEDGELFCRGIVLALADFGAVPLTTVAA